MGELLSDARARLTDALKKLEGEGNSWPEASSLEAARAGAGEGVVLLIDIEVDDPPTRVNISIGERLLKRIDAAAQAGGMTRSGFLAQAARRSLGESDRPISKSNIDLEAATKRMQEELSALGRKLNEALGPDFGLHQGRRRSRPAGVRPDPEGGRHAFRPRWKSVRRRHARAHLLSMPARTDGDRRRELNRMRALATGLLVAMTAVFTGDAFRSAGLGAGSAMCAPSPRRRWSGPAPTGSR